MDLWGKKRVKKKKISIILCFRWLPRVLSPLEKRNKTEIIIWHMIKFIES